MTSNEDHDHISHLCICMDRRYVTHHDADDHQLRIALT